MAIAHPPVLWAQRKDVLYVTIDIQDCTSPKVKLDKSTAGDTVILKFSGSLADSSSVNVELELLNDVDTENTKMSATGRHVVLVIPKTKEEFWPRLTKTKSPHFVSVDWSKWVDEDEEDEAPPLDMGQLGNLGDFDSDDDEEEEQEEEEEEEEEEEKTNGTTKEES